MIEADQRWVMLSTQQVEVENVAAANRPSPLRVNVLYVLISIISTGNHNS